MTDHNPFAPLRIPEVEQGVVLGFACPACKVLQTPTLEPCGCYACTRCGQHVPQTRYARACDFTAELVNNPSVN